MSTEPLEFDSSIASKSIFTIAGIKVYIYGLSDLPKSDITKPKDVAVFYILHGRLSSHKFSESYAYKVLTKYKELKKKILYPNHGERVVDPNRNLSWNKGNMTHAMDMCSIIDKAVQDCMILIDYLPSYFQGYQFHNIILGTSLGGHACYRLAAKIPRKIEMIIPVIGCTDLCSLLINRVKNLNGKDLQLGLRKLSYEDLKLTKEQQFLWPEYFHNYLSKQDYQVAENFPNHVKVFAIFGCLDTIVPPIFSKEWTQDMIERRCYDDSIKVEYFEKIGHQHTAEMCDAYSKWLVENITY
ncbi:hypothetical protein PACTADRAFT_1341 [Pachysolen tannophilus NRRL Y-2460]|uniref:Peptidase S9 prolyl oligopeptidase catalytic domain-containing protein n=1 Tax=Pachysolen tannophilus NRRL Y-2460 TaxID=669874 RepID=A0A1E4TYD5_PACTA|nr:hypothetical protein PACTADRAFT_1341 [Pachysolen tannophilus NRRL Y-2460]